MRRPALLALSLLTAVTCGVAAQPADAALKKSKPLIVKDAAGDATGVGVALPTSQADSDILSWRLQRLDNRKKATALVGRIDLAAPPVEGRDYRIMMAAEGCSTYYLEVEMAAVLGPNAYLRHNCGGGATSVFEDVVTFEVKGKSLVFTVGIKSLPGDVRIGDTLTVRGAESVLHLGAVIFGTLDSAPAPSGSTYTIGQ